MITRLRSLIIVLLFVLVIIFVTRNDEWHQYIPDINFVRKPCIISPLTSIAQFYEYLDRPPQITCKKMMRIGGLLRKNVIDGDKYVCFDDKIGIQENRCTVLSFGINNEWSFDDTMAKFGCKIDAFDPTMGKEDHKRGEYISFHNLGISNKTEVRRIGKKQAKVDRYENILKIIGLENKTIDYLKMDVEGYELEFFNDMFNNSPHLLSKIKQIAMEIHPWTVKSNNSAPNARFAEYFEDLQKLECFGFRIASAKMNEIPFNHYNFQNVTRASCYEILWINTS